jgi:aspartate 1-decarboxylase
MNISVLKSKVHRAVITEANLHYVGSLTLDEDLMDAANMIENEKVTVVNVNNGERLDTYLIKGKRGSGVCCLNGPAARKGMTGDVVVIISYCSLPFEEAKTFLNPGLCFRKMATGYSCISFTKSPVVLLVL